MPSTFREKDFLPQNGKNCPKNTIIQISPQFHLIWLTSYLGTSVQSFKWIGLAVLEKMTFWPKTGKNSPKIQLCKFHYNFNKLEWGHAYEAVYQIWNLSDGWFRRRRFLIKNGFFDLICIFLVQTQKWKKRPGVFTLCIYTPKIKSVATAVLKIFDLTDASHPDIHTYIHTYRHTSYRLRRTPDAYPSHKLL